jgi:exopolyphosphatase/guanosine-5'-triphosphate,3'-diphosphate pyrophosphatase
MNQKDRLELPGVSQGRAAQIVSGAVVALEVMKKLEIAEIQICPWALREGIVLQRMDWLKN